VRDREARFQAAFTIGRGACYDVPPRLAT
jgi:hypothetical protein